MAKVFGIHELELRPGVSADEFERFMREEAWQTFSQIPLQRLSLLKGDRGARDGKFLFLFEFESVETRDMAAPLEGEAPEELQQFATLETVQRLLTKWGTLATEVTGESIHTDYVVVLPNS